MLLASISCLEAHVFHEACSVARHAALRLLVASGSRSLFDLTRTDGTLEVLCRHPVLAVSHEGQIIGAVRLNVDSIGLIKRVETLFRREVKG